MKDETFQTKDFYISCCLLSAGLELIKLKRGDNKFTTFIFADPENKANQIISDHWQRKLVLPSKDIISAISELKTRLYSKHA
jgi:hypothetical protein